MQHYTLGNGDADSIVYRGGTIASMSFSQAFEVYLCSYISVPSLSSKCAHCLHTIRSHQRLQRKELHTEMQMHNLDTKGPTPQRYCDKMTPSENITGYFMKIYLRKFHFIQVQTETAVNLIGGVRVEGRGEEAGWEDDAVKENY